MTKLCPVCGKEFEPVKRQIYCSVKCKKKAYYQKNFKKRIIKKCKNCGNNFESDGRQKYCSDECRKEANRKRLREKYKYKDLRTVTCPVCGKEFKTNRNNQKFCSDLCREQYYFEYRREYRKYSKKYYQLNSRISYPCYRYSRPENIPDEWCLSCPVPKCRYDND